MSDAPSVVRPISLSVQNFRGLRDSHQLSLDRGLTLLVGANGTGKSSLLVALEWCQKRGVEDDRVHILALARRGRRREEAP